MKRFFDWFYAKRLWLRGGLIGVAICLFLGAIYVLVYFPLIRIFSREGTPNYLLLPPTITGHFFPLFSGFIVPYGWLCEFSQTVCTHWSVHSAPGAVPWSVKGHPGYCLNVTHVPSATCAQLSGFIGFYGLLFLLFAAYFIIGAIIGLIVQRRGGIKNAKKDRSNK